MTGGVARRIALVLCGIPLLLPGCGDPQPQHQDRKIPAPKGENALDDLIRRSAPAAPVNPGRLAADRDSVDFPDVALGGDAERQIRLTNDGGQPLAIAQVHLSGQASAFRAGGTCGGGAELAAGASCVVDVVFHPRREGAAEAELVITHSGVGSPLFLSLGGMALPRTPPAPLQVRSQGNAMASLDFAARRQEGGLVFDMASAGQDGDGAPGPGRDADYVEAGIKGIVSTFPVDRTRVITADRYIPAVLENTLSSQLPGRAIAVVERNVFGAEGRTVLIPAGSRVIGQYRSLGRYGESRLDVIWSRILRPDGVSVAIEDHGTDVMGRSGLPGDLDTRFFEKYGSSLLTSSIAAAGEWALNGNSTTITGPLGNAAQSMDGRARAANRLGNDLDMLAQRMIQENVDIRPVLTVPAGTRLDIVPSEDIWLRDPNHLRAATPPKDGPQKTLVAGGDRMMQMAPGLVEMVAQNPGFQRLAPQTAQQIMQSSVLQQLRDTASQEAVQDNRATMPAGAADGAGFRRDSRGDLRPAGARGGSGDGGGGYPDWREGGR